MHELLKTGYGFSEFQIKQLNYVWKTFSSEFSKLLIMGIIFHQKLGVYLFAVIIMMLLRSATGGLHCRKFLFCFIVSLSYMILALSILPRIPVEKPIQMMLLFLCILANYYIGPVTSEVHRPLSGETQSKVRLQAFIVIFFYLIITYIVPESLYITTGFWVIILHTAQLIAARLKKLKGVHYYERKIYQVE
ncbi:MAG: accessory gene regulator B family protein [Bacillota bacterium]|nr:accessory gene regulator B family protein [Bacillota bacterium]